MLLAPLALVGAKLCLRSTRSAALLETHIYNREANSSVLFCSPDCMHLFVCFDRTAVIVMIDETHFDTSAHTRKDF